MLRVGFVLCMLGAIALAAKFPENQEKCRHSDEACFIRVAHQIVQRANIGYPELGLPVSEPLRIEKLNIEQGGDGPVNLKIHLRNFDLRGLSATKFTRFEGLTSNTDRSKLTVKFNVPQLELDGPYKIDGKVLILPVQGNGKTSMKFKNVDVVLKLQTNKILKQGKKYLQVEKSKVQFNAEGVNIHFEGLFNGNKELGDTTNQFFNENWKDILKEIRPSISDAFNSVFVALINNVFGNIPYDDLFIPE